MYYNYAETSIKSKSCSTLYGNVATGFNQSAQESTASRRCLVVDDNKTIMRLVAQMLAAIGHQVDMAENGAGALGKISASRYDLVVTDLQMPVMSGYRLASRIKKESRDTKTVIMTERCHAEVFELMNTNVVDAWLFKPFDIYELFRVLDDLDVSAN